MTEPSYVRFIGGDTGRRSLLGGRSSTSRTVALVISIVIGFALTLQLRLTGMVIGLVAVLLTFLVTAATDRGSLLNRWQRNRVWRVRRRAGTAHFRPFEPERYEELVTATQQGSRQERIHARRELAAMRVRPDGAHDIGWLQHERRTPGIGWRIQFGRGVVAPQTLFVTFEVAGQVRGLESDAKLAAGADAFGTFLASRAASSSLLRQLQLTTRVVPADTALQEFWIVNNLDRNSPPDAVRSYAEVLSTVGAASMVQRHFVTGVWPVTDAFTAAASRLGDHHDGWRALMQLEIDSTIRALDAAQLGPATALTARQVTALMLHQQNPSRPVDLVDDVHPAQLGLASHDEFSAHIVDGLDPVTGQSVQWWHSTARVTAQGMSVMARSPLWAAPILWGGEVRAVRTVAFQLELVPAGFARSQARMTLTGERADMAAAQRRGQHIDTDNPAYVGAQRRLQDLAPGSGHHGVNWVGHITVSAPTRAELIDARRQLIDVCATQLGIDRLDWLDGNQAAAMGTTFPVGGGLRREQRTAADRVTALITGTGHKEALT